MRNPSVPLSLFLVVAGPLSGQSDYPTPSRWSGKLGASATLLVRTETRSWHAVLHQDGQLLVLTERETGRMRVVLSTGVVAIPTVRQTYTSSCLLGVLVHGAHVHALSWQLAEQFEPVRHPTAKPRPRELFALQTFAIDDGRQLDWRTCDPAADRDVLRVVDAGSLAGPLRVDGDAVSAFGREPAPVSDVERESRHRQQEAAREHASTPLLGASDRAWWHVLLHREGQLLAVTDRRSGHMRPVLSAGIVEVAGARTTFTSSCLLGALVHGEHVHVLGWRLDGQDRPWRRPPRAMLARPVRGESFTLRVFARDTGEEVRSGPCAPGADWFEPHGPYHRQRKALGPLASEDLAGPLRVVDGEVRAF